RGRGVDPPLALGLRHALHAMRAALVLEDRVRPVALHGEHDLLEAPRLALARRQELGAIAAALGVAPEHAVEVPGPERRLVAADALAHLDDDVLRVRGIALDERQLQLVFEPRETLLELRGQAR